MKPIAFADIETNARSKILDIGCIKSDGRTFHKASLQEFGQFLQGAEFLAGHNIIYHDLKYLRKANPRAPFFRIPAIDTLYLSPLLFPGNPYHALVKDDKLQTDEANNPLNDAIKARDLFFDEVNAFQKLDERLQRIFYGLLKEQWEFGAFFQYLDYWPAHTDPKELISAHFKNSICANVDLSLLIEDNPVELAYCLSLIHANHRYSITPPWVLKNYPQVQRIMHLLRNKPCVEGCNYCDQALDVYQGLDHFFGFQGFRSYGGEPLQEKAVKAAVAHQSILAVFPTGGGKSITFQLPALMSGENTRGLTVVISPLQSLMKDQVDNLEKAGITEAVTINGLLDPVERAKSFERVEDGSASLLYISPESLRSRTIERLLLGRNITRFVIDEAHCFSAWGQDFRVDYLYIADFIKNLQRKKNGADAIPVSCFTATAKQKVIGDIRRYFRENLSLELQLFTARVSRTNLHYKVLPQEDEEEKYNALRNLIGQKNCPTIVYVSRTRRAYLLAQRLTDDGFDARPYHGKMDKAEKTINQDAFIEGEVPIMVATSAFGMGVDKKDVGMVVHYEISDSLENYVQEAGRAGRDEKLQADCFVLFNEEDLSKHFILLNQTKLSIKEIQQVWNAIKYITKFRNSVSQSALEIARKAGWDDTVAEIETRVTTAISALEEAGYLKRGQNMPRVFANSILSKNAQEAIEKIRASPRFNTSQKLQATRIIKKLFSSKSRKHASEEEAESRVDYISDHLGIVKEEVIRIINLLREEKILADTRDLTAFIRQGENSRHALNILESFAKIENFLLPRFGQSEQGFHLKQLNEEAEEQGLSGVSPHKIKTILNFWAIKNWIKRQNQRHSQHHVNVIALHPEEKLRQKLEKRHQLARFILHFLYERSQANPREEPPPKPETLVEFSVHELKEGFEKKQDGLFRMEVGIADVEDALFYLSRIEALKIEGGFLVVYNQLTLERLELNNKIRYKQEDYSQLKQFYKSKVQQIHIVGEYARRMITDYRDALQFVEDYFQLNYSSFLRKYFPGSKADELKLKMTPGKFKKLFGQLSPTQLKIIKDNETQHIAVAAGPGSGKTRVLVHKLASLLLMEDVKHEQLLMVTFSRAAATEFKKRLISLIGNAALYVEIKTFHSYCFDLLGRVGSLEKSQTIIQQAVEAIQKGEVERNRITKTVLVIDEAQDMDKHEYALIRALMEQNEEMRVIAVGDDDQNIYEFRGARSEYLEDFMKKQNATVFELVENYRSKSNLVHFSHQFVQTLQHRLKRNPIMSVTAENGRIKVVHYQSDTLLVPLVKDILSADLSGTTCVLTHDNEEARQITGMLLKEGMPARLIQSNDGFNLYHLLEVRFFLDQLQLKDDTFLIAAEDWEHAKKALKDQFRNSTKLPLCLNLLEDFETTHPKRKYRSDLEVFIRESKLEDFYHAGSETIMVSTIHKAKGREFDNVFLLLPNFYPKTEEQKRQVYVALTRAKQNLSVHLNRNFLTGYSAENLIYAEDRHNYPAPPFLALHPGYKDVWLDYFASCQSAISQLQSGDPLTVEEHTAYNAKGQPVLRFSKRFTEELELLREKGYVLERIKVNFILY
ncbi:MAG TPA: RecQ family ATP-dependent DNA helicase, partial [Cryomorphaceae bacterium]|nr:RecQ family ATP-dependent DNA helicase [Cryomorphaceae bacterium]